MNHAGIEAILLDKDGVLLDFQKTYGFATRKIITRLSGGDDAILSALARAVGFSLCDNSIRADSPLVAGHAAHFCGIWAGVLGIENRKELHDNVDLMYKALTEKEAVLIDGVGDVLDILHADYRIGIATNDTEDCARAQLANKDMVHHLDFLAGYDSGYGAKPGTGMALAFCKAMQLAPGQIIMVGDSVHDMTFARDAGMTAVGIATGPLPIEELAPHADHCIDGLGELPDLLLKLQAA